jgi:hypothetical protein
MTFAGYNAGRGRVKQWVAQHGDPRDPKIDAVDLLFTTGYHLDTVEGCDGVKQPSADKLGRGFCAAVGQTAVESVRCTKVAIHSVRWRPHGPV